MLWHLGGNAIDEGVKTALQISYFCRNHININRNVSSINVSIKCSGGLEMLISQWSIFPLALVLRLSSVHLVDGKILLVIFQNNLTTAVNRKC